MVLSLAAVLPLAYGLKEMAQAGWSPAPVTLALAGLLAGVVFVVRQGRLAHPLLDLRLLRIPEVRGALLISLLVGVLQSGSGFFVAQHLQSVAGLSPLRAGLCAAADLRPRHRHLRQPGDRATGTSRPGGGGGSGDRRDAFAAGLNVTAAVCAVAFAGIAVLALTTLRRIPPFGPPAAR
ncbi:hypothetical protein [Nonomuraea harbinensis]|uniref:MFS transporter n=1 Tax=Nonomuraea harbinensis TaxID=1286938 RepID=A0ABW1C5W3_9ACTN|nr:hypothetical protein [Nonomuraea harbinensis]